MFKNHVYYTFKDFHLKLHYLNVQKNHNICEIMCYCIYIIWHYMTALRMKGLSYLHILT